LTAIVIAVRAVWERRTKSLYIRVRMAGTMVADLVLSGFFVTVICVTEIAAVFQVDRLTACTAPSSPLTHCSDLPCMYSYSQRFHVS